MKDNFIKNRRISTGNSNSFQLGETPAEAACYWRNPHRPEFAVQCYQGRGRYPHRPKAGSWIRNLKSPLSTGRVLKTCVRNVALIIIAIIIFGNVRSQDKASLVKEFNKVMSFSVRPYLHYTTYTTMQASPVLQQSDTLSEAGEFFKNGDAIYYRSSKEEMFVEDSFFIRINNEKKTIWISKLDVNTKDRMNVLPLSSHKMQKFFEKEYSVSKTAVNEASSRLNFHPSSQSLSGVTTDIGLQYSNKEKTPELMQLNITMKRGVTDEMVKEVKNAGNEETKLIQVINGQPYLIRQQSVTIYFENIDYSKQKAMQIPSWKSRISFDQQDGVFRGKGNYADYEITKTF